MAAKRLSLYLLAVAGLGVVRAAPLILDQRQSDIITQNHLSGTVAGNSQNGPGTVAQGPSHGAVKQAAYLILDHRDGGNGSFAQELSADVNVTSGT